MSDISKGVLEDQRKGILLSDFSGGIVTDTGGLSLAANQSPDSLNVFAWEGNLHFRGGYDQFSTLPSSADGAFTYYDVNDTAHMLEWSAGNLYEVTTGSPVTVASGVYTPGQTIAHAQLNGVLYWSTITVPLRQWDGTTEKQTANAGGTGTVPPPSCSFLITFNGALVAVDFVVNGVRQRGAFIWSDVNDPTKWFGNDTQTVGSNDGGTCVFAILMGVAQVGVSPTKQFMVGKNNREIFLYEGALGSLIENAVSSPVGIADGASAVYIPTQAGLGAVVFLGDDSQFYQTNGIECPMISQNIKLLCSNLVGGAIKNNAAQKFNAVYNQRFLYYMCDLGNNTQLIYKWDTGAWWLFNGWPSGVYLTAPTDNGLPSIFVGANSGSTTGVYELALDQTDDNGSDIVAYWTSAYIHGGKPERLKIFQEVTMFSYNVGVQYAVTGTGLPQSNGIVPTASALLFNDPAVGAVPAPSTAGALWGVAKWGAGKWSGPPTSVAQPYVIGGMKGPLKVPSPLTKWGPGGYPTPLRSGAAQFRIAWNAGVPDFRVTSFKIAFLPQNENVGVLPYTGQGQVVTTTDALGNTVIANSKYTNTGNPLPLNLPAPPTSACYSIINGQLTRTCVAGDYVVFALSAYNPGQVNPVLAWDNNNQVAVLDNITGESGIAIDARRNIIFSEGYYRDLFGTSDTTLLIDCLVPLGSTALTGPFASPGYVNYSDYAPADSTFWQSTLLSADRSTLFAYAYNNSFPPPTPTLPNGEYALKVDVATGAILASSAGSTNIFGNVIFLSPDGTKLYAVGTDDTLGNTIRVNTYSTSDLSIINSTAISATAAFDGVDGAGMSPDGSTIVVTIVNFGTSAVTAYVYDTTAHSATSFAVGTFSLADDFNNPVTFPKGDSAHVLIFINGNIVKFDLSGSTIATYAVGLTAAQGAIQMITEPNSGLIYGSNFTAAAPAFGVLWVYDLNASALLTEQAAPAAADGSGIYYLAFPNF